MSAREAYKTAKYSIHSQQAGRAFVPFVLDCYGCLASAALQLLKDIRDESLSLPGSSHPFRFSRSSFLQELSRQWQYENARIVVQWMTLVRSASQRSLITFLPPPLVPILQAPTAIATSPSGASSC